jgi:hypothetical protein
MSISSATLLAIEQQLLDLTDETSNPLTLLKQQFPHIHFLRMAASDIDQTAFRSLPRFDLHLLDGREHCVQLTADPEAATSIVLAAKF